LTRAVNNATLYKLQEVGVFEITMTHNQFWWWRNALMLNMTPENILNNFANNIQIPPMPNLTDLLDPELPNHPSFNLLYFFGGGYLDMSYIEDHVEAQEQLTGVQVNTIVIMANTVIRGEFSRLFNIEVLAGIELAIEEGTAVRLSGDETGYMFINISSGSMNQADLNNINRESDLTDDDFFGNGFRRVGIEFIITRTADSEPDITYIVGKGFQGMP
jgi:hypothetical protein